MRPWLAYDSVTSITGNLLLPMSDAPLVFAIVTLIWRTSSRSPTAAIWSLLGASVGGVIMATLLFTTSTRSYDGYWFLTLTTALTLTFGMAIAAIPSKTAVKWIGLAMLLHGRVAATRAHRRLDAVLQVSAVRHDAHAHRAQLIMRGAGAARYPRDFEVHPTMDRHFIYRILGGRIDGRRSIPPWSIATAA